MSFLKNIFQRLRHADRPVLQEVREGKVVSTTGAQFLLLVRAARGLLLRSGLKKGDRCALLAHNSTHWAALNVALMAEGVISVPLYARQAPAELMAMMKDCAPALLCCGDGTLADVIREQWPDAPPIVLFDEIFNPEATGGVGDVPVALGEADPVTIIYTSGTSGEPKGVVLNVGNVNHMLLRTTARLDLLMGPRNTPDRIFHYLPFCFAGSWILLLSALSRDSVLTFSTDLTKLADEIRLAAPNYFLNVPALLERVKTGVEGQLNQRGGFALKAFRSAPHSGFWRLLARLFVYPTIRKKISPNLKALICGSAPLAAETQRFFMDLGIPVLQVYGLTETTGICTMDHPHGVEPGRVGPAISGIEMTLGEQDEILVRGPNIFPGYWNRPEETAKVIRDGWFHTGDQGECDAAGNWRIIGRIKNLIVLSSGHNIAPEPIEETLVRAIPGAQQVLLAGHGRSYLAAIITGDVEREPVEAALARVNGELPHYKRVHAFHIRKEPFTIENGLLTANGKLRRDAIAAALAREIEELYRPKEAQTGA